MANTLVPPLTPVAPPDMIDKNTHEIRQALDDYDEARVYKSLEEVAEDLPDHTPRFVLLSYPLTTVCAVHLFSVPPAYLPCHLLFYYLYKEPLLETFPCA